MTCDDSGSLSKQDIFVMRLKILRLRHSLGGLISRDALRLSHDSKRKWYIKINSYVIHILW